MRNIDERCMEKFGTLGTRWPKTSKQEGDMNGKTFLCDIWKNSNERAPKCGGVPVRSSSGAPSQKGRVVNGQVTNSSSK